MGTVPSPAPADVLDLRVFLEPPAPALAADAALLEAAERGVDEVEAVVDPHRAGADAACERHGARRVTGVDRAAEAVGRVVGDAHRLVVVAEGDHGHHRPEDLLAGDADVVRDVAEDGGLDEPAAREARGPAAAARQ